MPAIAWSLQARSGVIKIPETQARYLMLFSIFYKSGVGSRWLFRSCDQGSMGSAHGVV